MKIGFFITARLKSSRLKQKILLDLNGKSVIDCVIERCKSVQGIDGVVLCTSTNPQDSILYKNALANQIEFYAGSEDDVLKRLLDAARYYGYDAFLSITADNPLHSVYIGQQLVDLYKKNKFDFIFTEGLPIGIAPYFINTNALQIACEMKRESNTEIWGPFCNRPDFFNVGYLKIKDYSIPSSCRITCDYPVDYKLIRLIYNKINKESPTIFDMDDLYLDDKLIFSLNESVEQNSVSDTVLQVIRSEFDNNINHGVEIARSIGHNLVPNSTIIELNLK